MGNEEKRGKYLVSQAQQVKSRLNILISEFAHYVDRDAVAQVLWRSRNVVVRAILQTLPDDHLGKIACAGPPAVLNKISPDVWELAGWVVSLEVATHAIVSALADITWADLQKAKTQAEAKPKTRVNRLFDEGNRFIAHFGGFGGHWYFQSIEDQEVRLTVGCLLSGSAHENEKKVEQIKNRAIWWVPTEKEYTVVLEIVEGTGQSKKGVVLFTHAYGPNSP